MKSWCIGRCAPVSLLGLLSGLIVFGNCTQAPAQALDQKMSTFYAPIEVPLVSVDVFVSDRQGRPIKDLGVDDFQVFEDGRPMEISHFYAAPGVVTTGLQSEIGESAADQRTAPEAPPNQDILLVVYVDDTNISRSRRRAAVDHIEKFFASDLPGSFKVMVVAYDGRIHVVQPFTDDVVAATAALEELNGMASLSRRSDEDRIIRDMQATRDMAATSPDQAEAILTNSGIAIFTEIQSYADQLAARTRTSFENLEKMVRSLSGLDGRKALLLVSDGVEPRPGERLFRSWAETFGDVPIFRNEAAMAFNRANQYALDEVFTKLTHHANSHRVTLYTLSALNDATSRMMSAEQRFVDESRLSVVQGMSEEVLMSSMADSTGGRPLVNSPALGQQLNEVAEELGSYYSLAYQPEQAGDGKYHQITVKVTSEGSRVRHREGYYDTPQSDRISDRTLAAAIHGMAQNPMGIQLHTFDPTLRDDGTFLVPVLVIVPIGELVLMPTTDKHEGRISILLAVRDEEGGLSDLQRLEYPIPVPNDEIGVVLGKTVGFTVRLGMRAGKQRVAVGVVDEIGRTESVTTLEVALDGAGG